MSLRKLTPLNASPNAGFIKLNIPPNIVDPKPLKKGLKLSQELINRRKELEALKEKEEAARRSAVDRMFREGKGGRGQDFTGGRFDRAGSRAEYDRDPTGFSGSSKDGGIIGYGGTSGTPLYQQFMNGGLADLVDIYD